LILNTRYKENLTTIITTNFADEPAAGAVDPGSSKASESFATARAAARQDTLGDRIGETMRSRLHEMCRTITLDSTDYRQEVRSADVRHRLQQ